MSIRLYTYRITAVMMAVVGLVMLITADEELPADAMKTILMSFGLFGMVMFLLDVVPALFSWIKSDLANHAILIACIISALVVTGEFRKHLPDGAGSDSFTFILFALMMGIAMFVMAYINRKKKKAAKDHEEDPDQNA